MENVGTILGNLEYVGTYITAILYIFGTLVI
jgi:hypothetical protein